MGPTEVAAKIQMYHWNQHSYGYNINNEHYVDGTFVMSGTTTFGILPIFFPVSPTISSGFELGVEPIKVAAKI